MKTILLLLLSACWLPMQAQQTYHSMLQEGKTWNFSEETTGRPLKYNYQYSYFLEGDVTQSLIDTNYAGILKARKAWLV